MSGGQFSRHHRRTGLRVIVTSWIVRLRALLWMPATAAQAQAEPEKRETARLLVKDALETQQGVISWQVVQEFLNVARRKFPRTLTSEHLRVYLEQFLTPLCRVYPSMELYHSALQIAERRQYYFYDSLILAAAQQAGSQVLFTEDLQHDQWLLGLRIVNPFLPS